MLDDVTWVLYWKTVILFLFNAILSSVQHFMPCLWNIITAKHNSASNSKAYVEVPVYSITFNSETVAHCTSWQLCNRNKYRKVYSEGVPILYKRVLVKTFSVFYGTRIFIIVFTRARHWSLSWARRIQSTTSQPISHLRLGLQSGLFPSGFPINILYEFLNSLMRATRPSYSPRFDHRGVQYDMQAP
jgi:hypothetical protein